ncbi:MAG: acylphosphatase [candidate division WOR-3 bacterium]|nr:acylphosphatase [candidate division WOR-3 bacterium]
MKHLNITLKGYVQGVGFRYFTVKTARRLGVTGYVKNMPNGNVYIEAEGEEYQLEDFVNNVKIGPASADVRDIDISEGETENFTEFDVRY